MYTYILMHIYGLTGGIASGKSTVTTFLKELNCPVIDADIIAREVVQPGKPAWKRVLQHFGTDVLQPNGEIDRAKLAAIIFTDEKKRYVLNQCTHPFIRRTIILRILESFLCGADFVVLVSPLLFESGKFLWMLRKTIVVTCTDEQELERLRKRDNISEAAAIQKIRAQLPLTVKRKRADFIIDNSGSLESTREQAKRLHEEMTKSSAGRGTLRWVLLVSASILLSVAMWLCYY